MKFDPKWLHALQHALSKELGKCKSCGESHKKLYHCKNCMVGIYCSSQCQSLDNEHPCLIAKRGRDDEGREAAGGPPAQRRRPEERQLGDFAAFPRDILVLLLTYLAPNDILNVRELSRALNQLVMDHPDHLPQIPVRLTIEQMYQISEEFRPWIRNLTITDNYRMTVEHLAYLARAFPSLRKLYLSWYRGENIEPLRGLVDLQTLSLSSYRGDLEPLRGLENLQVLNLWDYQGDIEPLRGLVNLRVLYLRSYQGDLGPLRGLSGLQYLNLYFYQGDNIEPLRDLVNLQTLGLYSYQGDSIEPLRGLVNLQTLDLASYRGDIEPLSGLENLRELDLVSYHGDLEPLRGLVNLQKLDLWYHPDQAAVRALKRELGIN